MQAWGQVRLKVLELSASIFASTGTPAAIKRLLKCTVICIYTRGCDAFSFCLPKTPKMHRLI